ncbi:hypothetical protein YYC_02874 [Plasmodium yoelii 17X]|uniref:Uncharacterized protein n=1 Tax=Plasmodium yoelii 17X TaxID=1323249 RepID=V7PIG7_PLAYE|nr:hypothetical protein YYC_02874 [Plasmodium yoelii 17X]
MLINLSGFFIKKERDHINITHVEFIHDNEFPPKNLRDRDIRTQNMSHFVNPIKDVFKK